jgi:hypothetical protein
LEKRESQLREKRYTKDKYTYNDYKKYIQNSGFGQPFGTHDTETKAEKLEKIKKRNDYGMAIRQHNINSKTINNNDTRYLVNSRFSNFSDSSQNSSLNSYYNRVMDSTFIRLFNIKF